MKNKRTSNKIRREIEEKQKGNKNKRREKKKIINPKPR